MSAFIKYEPETFENLTLKNDLTMHQSQQDSGFYTEHGREGTQEMPLNFTIKEEHVGRLDNLTKDIQERFNVTVTIEQTSYAQSEFSNLRWIHVEGKDRELMKCAKAYITSLCSPENQESLDYPLELHDDIAGKKDGLEHRYEYKAVVTFQQRGKIMVSGKTEEVLMLLSVLEDEMNHWRLRLRDSRYFSEEEQEPCSKKSDKFWQHRHLQSESQREDQLDSLPMTPQSHLVVADSGINTRSDLVPERTSRVHVPHTNNAVSNPSYHMTSQASHSSRETHQPQLMKIDNNSQLNQNRDGYNNTVTGYEKAGFAKQTQIGQSTYGRSTYALPSQNRAESNNYRWVERGLPREDTLSVKDVHTSTPPRISVDHKRQRTGVPDHEGFLVTDSVESANSDSSSSFGSSEHNARRYNSGSSKSSSLDYASTAAQRQGYSDQEVEVALKELPPNFKTSDLIKTLSRRRHPSSSFMHPNGTSSQPYHSYSSRTEERSSSPLSDPWPASRRSPVLNKHQSASQPLPQNFSGSVNPSQSPRRPSSTSKKIDTLRRKQQELLESLGSQPIGRPPDQVGQLSSDSSFADDRVPNKSTSVSTSNQTLSSSKERPSADERVGIAKDVTVLNDEEDMECAAEIEYVEKMDVEQDVEYMHTTFPEGAESPDVLLISPPKKRDPELVIIDDENIKDASELKAAQTREIFHTTRTKPASPINTRRRLAANFNISPQVYSDNPKMSASMPTMSKQSSFRTSQPQYIENNQFKTMDDWKIEEEPRVLDEADSPPRSSPVESKMQIGIESQQRHSRESTSSPFGDKQGVVYNFSSVKEEPLDELIPEDQTERHGKALDFDSENMETDSHDQKVDILPKAQTIRPFQHLKLERMHPSDLSTSDSAEEQLRTSGQTLQKSPKVPDVKIEVLDEKDPSDTMSDVQEIGVRELLKNFQADFESQKEEFERKIKERTLNETLNMVAEQNEAMQRQLNQKQKESSDGKESVTGQDIDEKLRAERKKINEKQKKVMQKMGQQFQDFKDKVLKESEEKLQEQYKQMMQKERDELQQQQVQEQQRLLQEQQEAFQKELQKMQKKMQEEMRKQQEKMQEQMRQQMEQQQKQVRPVPGAAAAAIPAEKDVIVIKPSKKGTPSPYRPIVIDGSNVAMLHGKRHGTFSCRGIALCVQYFQNLGIEDITVFVPRWRKTQHAARHDRPIRDQEILDSLESKGLLSFTPSRKVQGRYINSYDDRFIVRLAAENGGVIVSNDNFRDLMEESEKWKNVIETKLLMYTFAGDQFMIPDDPYGRDGPTLQELLLKPKQDTTQRMIPTAGTQAAMRQQEPPGLNEHQIEQLTYSIGMEWERLGTYLRFSHSEITKIKRDFAHHTDGAIHHMLNTWNGRQRNKPNQFDVLAEALRHSGRTDLAEMVLRWKQDRYQGGGKGKGRGGGAARGKGQQGMLGQAPGPAGLLGAFPQQAHGGRPRQNAPATLSKPPEVDVKQLPQFQSLKEMFPDKEDEIVKLLKENPNYEENDIVDKLLMS